MSKKLADFEWDRDPNESITMSDSNQQNMLSLLNSTGPGFCLAKWTQVTMHLGNGLTHSCHHPHAHTIPLKELTEDAGSLHNTIFKMMKRKEMLAGKRPTECDFCWRIEDNGGVSDRVFKSLESFSFEHHDKISSLKGDEFVFPTYVEVSFGRTCNFACAYCGPPFSSKWEQEIKKQGPIMNLGQPFNSIVDNETHILARDHNPYIEAFWNWFPEAYKHMHTFRITGGEPLLIKDTFKVIDFLIANPNPKLEFAINSNACPTSPGAWKKFCAKIKVLTDNNCVKKFELYTSAEATGDRCDYIRDGMDWKTFVKNIHYFLDNTSNTRVVFMCAFNILSITSFKDLLEWVLLLKTKYSYHGFFKWLEDEGVDRALPSHDNYTVRGEENTRTHNRVGIDVPYVRWPQFLDPCLIDVELLNKFLVPAGDFMYSNMGTHDWYLSNKFEAHECSKLRRNIVDCILHIKRANRETGLHEDPKLKLKRARFVQFIDEYDKRRGKNFHETFPEYADFYKICKAEEAELENMDSHDGHYEDYKRKQKARLVPLTTKAGLNIEKELARPPK